MSTKTKQEVRPMEQLERPPEKVPPMYSQEFLLAMEDYAYHTLANYLETQHMEAEVLELLHSLLELQVIVKIYQKSPLINPVWNDQATSCVGQVSKAIPKLGGHFITPSGMLVMTE